MLDTVVRERPIRGNGPWSHDIRRCWRCQQPNKIELGAGARPGRETRKRNVSANPREGCSNRTTRTGRSQAASARILFLAGWALLCSRPQSFFGWARMRRGASGCSGSSPPAPPTGQAQLVAAKDWNQSVQGSWARETFLQHSFWQARGRGRGKAGAGGFGCRRQLRRIPGSGCHCWPYDHSGRRGWVLNAGLCVGAASWLAIPPRSLSSRARPMEPGAVGPRGKRAVDSAVGRSLGGSCVEALGGAAWMATASPLGGFLGPEATCHRSASHLAPGATSFPLGVTNRTATNAAWQSHISAGRGSLGLTSFDTADSLERAASRAAVRFLARPAFSAHRCRRPGLRPSAWPHQAGAVPWPAGSKRLARAFEARGSAWEEKLAGCQLACWEQARLREPPGRRGPCLEGLADSGDRQRWRLGLSEMGPRRWSLILQRWPPVAIPLASPAKVQLFLLGFQTPSLPPVGWPGPARSGVELNCLTAPWPLGLPQAIPAPQRPALGLSGRGGSGHRTPAAAEDRTGWLVEMRAIAAATAPSC